jgi:hypothetical protein
MPANPGAKKATEKAKKKREAAQRARREQNARAAARAPQVQEEPVAVADDGSPFGLRGNATLDFDALDELSAEAAVLIKQKKIDEAARKCAEIVRRFPGEPDGWQRFSAVWEARGDLRRALAEMERAAARVSKDDDVTARTIDVELSRLRKAVAKLG